jgi:hypothetical protein
MRRVGQKIWIKLQNHFHHRVRGERAVELVELLAAGGCHGDGDAEVFPALAFAQFDGGRIKSRIKLVGHVRDGMHQAFHLDAHDLDGELRRVFNERVFARLGGVGRRGGRWLGGCHLFMIRLAAVLPPGSQHTAGGRWGQVGPFQRAFHPAG